jgi:hypothetical protein
MMNLRLEDFLGQEKVATAAWARFGLLENPFPSRSHPVWDVFHNQQQVLQRFYTDLGEFIREGKTTTLFFTGGNRVGKTHFCEHHRMALPGVFAKRELIVPMAVVPAESCRFSDLYRPIIDQLGESLRLQTGHGLFTDSWRQVLQAALETMGPGDFREAARTYLQASQDQEAVHSLLMQWLRGERLRITQRRQLGVGSVIESLAHELNALEGIIATLRKIDKAESMKCPGVILFIDEFELIWTHRRDKRDRFLQALRALVDACPDGLFMCVAMATGVGYEFKVADLEAAYPALFARLKGARDVPTLVEVAGVIEAQEYAQAFLDNGHKKALLQGIQTGERLFSESDVRRLFLEVAGGDRSASQGDFFDKLHVEAEEKVNNLSGQ